MTPICTDCAHALTNDDDSVWEDHTPEGTFPGEMDTTTTTGPTTITTTTHVTLPRPATAKQVADALTHVDGHHEVIVHTYPDRIEIEAHHEETQNRQ